MQFIYKGEPARGRRWAEIFAEKAPQMEFHVWPDMGDPSQVRYLAAWIPPDDIATRFPNLEVLFSVGAGIDQLDLSKVPAHLPVVRMMEPGLSAGMVEYVAHAVLTLHRDLHRYRQQQQARRWTVFQNMPAARRRVSVLGMGVLGRAVLENLRDYGFDCAGWSRTPHSLDGVQTFHGDDGLRSLLARTDILICLLPLTDSTRHILDTRLFAQLPRGAMLVNVGRGGHLAEDDLLAALDAGQLSHAILDVQEQEPPPDDHPFWDHPGVTLTPHIASQTQPDSACDVIIENLRRHRAGEPMLGLVDRQRGY